MKAEPDHLVVTAPSLAEGTEHVASCLGIPLHPGGAHPDMGTHNRLLRLGSSLYLEVIAIDPAADPPGSRRWFDLDGDVRAPRLATWVARCDDLDACAAGAGYGPGPIRPMRRGPLHWRIAFPADGALLEGGLLPPLIEWPADMQHPASALPDDGLELAGVTGGHADPDRVRQQLQPLGLDRALELHTAAHPRLEAHIRTPAGLRLLT